MPPAEITALLAADEKPLWTGQPAPSAYIVRGLPAILYGTTWSVLGAFWYHGSGGIGKYSAFEGWWKLTPLFSVPFILAGFSFFFYPLSLGGRARRTWYVVTDRRAFIYELPHRGRPGQYRLFTPHELGPPLVMKRPGGLSDVILTRRAQERPHLAPRLEDAFLGQRDPAPAVDALQRLSS